MTAADEGFGGAAVGYEGNLTHAMEDKQIAALEDEELQQSLLFDIREPQLLAHLRNVWNLVILKAGHHKKLRHWAEWARKEDQESTLFTKKVVEMIEAGISADVIKTACDGDLTITQQQASIFCEMVDHAHFKARIQNMSSKESTIKAPRIYQKNKGKQNLMTDEASGDLRPGIQETRDARGANSPPRSRRPRRVHRTGRDNETSMVASIATTPTDLQVQKRRLHRKASSQAGAGHNDHPGNDEVCESNAVWAILPCWVKCKANGDPAELFECAGVAEFKPFKERGPTSSRVSRPYEIPEKKSAPSILGAGRIHSQNARQPALQPSSPDEGKRYTWTHELPSVAVKEPYLCWSGIQAEGGEARSRRMSYPKEFKGDMLQLHGFRVYLEKRGLAFETLQNHALYAGRMLGALEVQGG